MHRPRRAFPGTRRNQLCPDTRSVASQGESKAWYCQALLVNRHIGPGVLSEQPNLASGLSLSRPTCCQAALSVVSDRNAFGLGCAARGATCVWWPPRVYFAGGPFVGLSPPSQAIRGEGACKDWYREVGGGGEVIRPSFPLATSCHLPSFLVLLPLLPAPLRLSTCQPQHFASLGAPHEMEPGPKGKDREVLAPVSPPVLTNKIPPVQGEGRNPRAGKPMGTADRCRKAIIETMYPQNQKSDCNQKATPNPWCLASTCAILQLMHTSPTNQDSSISKAAAPPSTSAATPVWWEFPPASAPAPTSRKVPSNGATRSQLVLRFSRPCQSCDTIGNEGSTMNTPTFGGRKHCTGEKVSA